MILEKNILQVHMRKKKIRAQDHRPKKNSRTYSGLEKIFWQDVPWADTLNFCISKLLKQRRIYDPLSDINTAKTFERCPCRRDTQQLMRFQENRNCSLA